MTHLRPALVLLVFLSLLTGGAYPLLVTGVAQVVFPQQANGSPLMHEGRVVGSTLIGQAFAQARYFHGRPSAAGAGYDARASSGSNLGPTSRALAERRAALADLPPSLQMASASGLDPDLPPEAAQAQAARVAQARGLDVAQVHELVRHHTARRTLGLLGEPRVNVLRLNLALDALTATPLR